VCVRTAVVQVTLPHDPSAPSLARQVVEDAACRAHHTGALAEAELLVTEVVTNAFRYGAPPITLEVTCEADDGLVVQVGDTGTAAPVPRDTGVDDVSGRGLALVDVMSDDWGVEPTRAGKNVWFRLRPPA